MKKLSDMQRATLVEMAKAVIAADPLLNASADDIGSFDAALERLARQVAVDYFGTPIQQFEAGWFGGTADGADARYDAEHYAVELSMFGKVVNINVISGKITEIASGDSLL